MFTYSLTRFTESRRDQEEGSELDSHEEVRLSLAGPGEIKWREVLLEPEESSKAEKSIRNADQALTVRGEHADRIVGSPSW